MSYILDALRKADAARERDPARGIHAQPVVLRTAATEGFQARSVAWTLGAVALGVLIAAAGFALLSRDDQPVTATPPRAEAPAGHAATPGGSVAAAISVPETPPAVRPATTATPANDPPAPATAILPAPLPVEPPKPIAKGAASAAAQQPAQPASERVYELAELPADVQGELPKLAISGGVHSNNPSQRMLIVAGQVVNEGAELAPGLRLEEIRLKTAVLSYRGYRFSVSF